MTGITFKERPFVKTDIMLRSIIGLASVIIFGTLGYMLIEKWSFLDGLYMTVITISSIGFGEVHPLSDTGRVFTLILVFMGFGVVGYVLVSGSKFIIEGEVQKIFTRRRSMKAKVAEDSAYAGMSLIDTDIRKDLNLIVIAIKKNTGKMVFNPGPQTIIEGNDTLIAMGDKSNLSSLEKKSHLQTSW
jgi:hypothetical protein